MSSTSFAKLLLISLGSCLNATVKGVVKNKLGFNPLMYMLREIKKVMLLRLVNCPKLFLDPLIPFFNNPFIDRFFKTSFFTSSRTELVGAKRGLLFVVFF